jgi:hypothetical protein
VSSLSVICWSLFSFLDILSSNHELLLYVLIDISAS